MGVIFALVLGVGCGGGDSSPDARPSFDAPNRSDFYFIVDKIVFPSTDEQVNASKFEFPGSGIPVNKLGALLKVMLDMLEGIPVQAEMEANILNGEGLQMNVFHLVSLTGNDEGGTAQYARVEDVDDPPDPSNNWDGEGTFRVLAGTEIIDAYKTASLVDGQFLGIGDDETDVPMLQPVVAGEEPYMSHGVHMMLRGTLDENGFDGAIGSAATPEEFIANVTPSGSRMMTRAIAEGTAGAQDIKNLFDENDDDVITEEELATSPTFATLSQPDIDLDGDGTYDHVSQALLVHMVPCQPLAE